MILPDSKANVFDLATFRYRYRLDQRKSVTFATERGKKQNGDYYTWKVAYQTDFSINKNGMSNHEMFMDFISLPYPDRNKTDDYYVFFSSLKEGDTQEKPMEGENPKVLRINPHDISQGEVDELENFCYYYAKVLKCLAIDHP